MCISDLAVTKFVICDEFTDYDAFSSPIHRTCVCVVVMGGRTFDL